MHDNEHITITPEELKALVDEAVSKAMRRELQAVGLADQYAAQDMQTLRSVAKTINLFQSEFWKSLAKMAGKGVAILFVLGVAYMLAHLKGVELPDITKIK